MDREKLLELCRSIQNGDKTGLESLYKECYSPLYYFVYGMVGQKEESEDIVHDTFLKLAKSINQFKEGNVLGWIFTIARNTFYDRLKKNKKIVQSLDSEEGIEDLATYEQSFAELDISDFMNKLKPAERELIVLKFWQGYEAPEIGRIVDKSSAAVRKEISRIIKKYK